MAPIVDSAIIEALSLDPEQTKITSHGASGFASSFKLTSVIDGQPTNFFVKMGSGKDAEIMFRGQSDSGDEPILSSKTAKGFFTRRVGRICIDSPQASMNR